MRLRHDESGNYIIDDNGNDVACIYEMAVAEQIMAEFAIKSENARLREALSDAWKHAEMMRNSGELVGPHADPKQNAIWRRALYHEGKDLMIKLRPYRNLISQSGVTK
jgi:hypothetical protein